jgi:hypothetical protein
LSVLREQFQVFFCRPANAQEIQAGNALSQAPQIRVFRLRPKFLIGIPPKIDTNATRLESGKG